MSLVAACRADDPAQGDPDAGRVFYRTGLTSDGNPVPVTSQGDVQSYSDRFPCVGCHRPSGFGSSEGGKYVPIITSDELFRERTADRARRNRRFLDLFKARQTPEFDADVRMPRMRPAYTPETLARAIRVGVDAADRRLSQTMPRYELDAKGMANLVAYLKTLSSTPSPGVDKDTLHIATVVDDRVPGQKRDAMLDTMRAFVKWYNHDIRGQMFHKGFSPYYRSEFRDSFRQLALQVWELKGSPDSWPDQLRDYYEDQPVFVELGGLVSGPWKPVDAFCEAKRLPCLFPNTNLPNLENPHYGYSIYFTRGLTLEGEVIARYLGHRDAVPKSVRQICVDQPAGEVPARAFAAAARTELPGTQVTTTVVSSTSALSASIAAADGDVLIVWPGDQADAGIEALNANPPKAERIFLPSTALDAARASLSKSRLEQVRLSFPYEKPDAYHPRQYRVRAWFGSRGVRLSYPRMQLQTYYALTQLQYGLDDIINDFFRDFLVESIEHEAEANLNPGIFPKMALGPGQRFVSKGAYVIALDPTDTGAGYHAVSDWIVP